MNTWKAIETTAAVEEKGAEILEGTLRQLPRLPNVKVVAQHYGTVLQNAMKGRSFLGSSTMMLTEHLRTVAVYDVRVLPAKKKVVAGKMVPTVRGGLLKPTGVPSLFMSRRRRLAIEIHGPPEDMRVTEPSSAEPDHDTERSAEEEDQGMERGGQSLRDHEMVMVRIYKSTDQDRSSEFSSDDDDDNKVEGESEDAFRVMRALPAEDVEILNRKKATCEIMAGHLNDTKKVYDVIFKSEKEAIDITKQFNLLRDIEKERSQRHAKIYLKKQDEEKKRNLSTEDENKTGNNNGKEESPHEPINLLVEIVSATNLPDSKDKYGSSSSSKRNPFVIVKLGRSEIHRTKVLYKTLDPIWSLETGSLFLIQMTPEEFFSSSGGMTFILVDSPSPLVPNRLIGRVQVGLLRMLEMEGRRRRFDILLERIKNDEGSESPSSPVLEPALPLSSACALYLRVKRATDSEIEFMKTYKQFAGLVGVYSDETYLLPNPPELDFFKYSKKMVAVEPDYRKKVEIAWQVWVPIQPDSRRKTTVRRVRPYPDPERPEETRWALPLQIELESRRPSSNWVQAGSGDLGALFVEVLGCNGLPNLSIIRTSHVLDRTSAFVCLVYEDTVVNTDAIADCLSPRWMPWSKRAFVFPMSHPQSDLFIGVFDYDMERSPLQMALTTAGAKRQHNRIGRCSVPLTQLNPDTTYELTYPLYLDGVKKGEGNSRGTITLRLRIHVKGTRKTLLAALKPPRPSFVSCPRRIDWEVAKYTVEGTHESTRYSINSFAKYIAELQDYQKVLPHVTEVLITCLFWRGHFRFHLCGLPFSLPLQSMVAFGWAIAISYNLDYIPSFFVFSVAWMFLASNEIVRRTPSPWEKPRSYGQLVWAFLFGGFHPCEIRANEGVEELRKFKESEDRKQRRREKARQLRRDYEKKLKSELQFILDETEVDDIATKAADDIADTLNLQPLKPTLYPVQLKLRKLVLIIRFVSKFFLWKEAYYAFWITTFSFLACLLVALVPWGLVLGWSIRVSLLFLTGPWWKLADWYLFGQPMENMTEEEHEAKVHEKLQKRFDQVIRTITAYQIKKERATKLKSMKNYLYGKFIVRIPRVSLELFADIPLPESSCSLHRENHETVVVKEQKFGQKLHGDMIPTRQIEYWHPELVNSPRKVRNGYFGWAERTPTKIVSKLTQNKKYKETEKAFTETTPLLSSETSERDQTGGAKLPETNSSNPMGSDKKRRGSF